MNIDFDRSEWKIHFFSYFMVFEPFKIPDKWQSIFIWQEGKSSVDILHSE